MSVLPPNPSLVAIIVLIKTKQGVKHVYHYPRLPGRDMSTPPPHYNEDNDNYSSDSDNAEYNYSSSSESLGSSIEDHNSSDPDNDSTTKSKHAKPSMVGSKKSQDDASINESGSTSPEKNVLQNWRAEKGHKGLLGLPPKFPEFLCPPDEMDRRRFEIVIGQLTFIGWPCFAKEDGTWKAKKKKKGSENRGKDDVRSGSAIDNGIRSLSIRKSNEDIKGAVENDASTQDEKTETELDETSGIESEHETTSETGNGNTPNIHEKLAASESGVNRPESSHESDQTLSMFHIVFVMNPPPLEYHTRVDDMYTHVAKPFSKALKREQARSGYVWKECEKLKAMKARHEPDSKYVLRSSRFAKVIAGLFNAISNSRMAHVALASNRVYWLHIPTPTSISSLPGPMEPQLPGAWLTTSTVMPANDELSSTGNKLASHFALLLLADVSSILAGISTRSPIRAALEHYLNHSTPTKSLLQISQKASIPLNDVILMASHLIHYKQARIIPPLHKKNIYIVSPNADMRRLRASAAQFQREFPLQASLTTILARLYVANRSYKAIIPNREYKEAYMNMLAWLMRGGWVTQLRTYAWIRVPSHVRKIVHDRVGMEKRSGEQKKKRKKRSAKNNETSGNEYESEETDTDDQGSREKHLMMMSSVHSATARSNVSTPSTVRSRTSTSSALTAVPIQNEQSSSLHSHSKHTLPALLIASPTKTSGIESRYLEYIANEIEQNDGIEVKEAWMRCLAFFDGQYALEQLPVRQDWKRSWIEGLRAGWVKDGWLVEVRSW